MSKPFVLQKLVQWKRLLVEPRQKHICHVGFGLLIGLLFDSFLLAQSKPMKWGDVPRADLEMKTFPEDSNATAVILCDFGEVTFNDQFGMVFSRHQRVKILSEAGYDWGSHAIQFYAKDKRQRVTDVEGQTFYLTAEGTVRREKLDKKSIFDEDVDGEWRRIRFTLPALAPGAVVEYRYTITTSPGYFTYLHGWEFQTSEPTLWSEFRADIPAVLQYVIVKQRLAALEVEETNSYNWPPTLYSYQTARMFNLKIMSHRWAMRNMPALREEPYMTTPDDFRAKIHFQLAQIVWPGVAPEKIMQTWEKLAEDLLGYESFGKQIERHKVLREQAETLVAGITNPEEKIRRIYDYVRTTMTWNREYGIYVDEDLDKAFQARRGGGPEIALMLTAMLRFAGLEAYPVLISTRNNGKIIQIYSILSQFNHVLTYVKAGSQEHLLDATDPLRPHTLLPVAALNEVGWLVDKKNPSWVDITSPGAFINQTIVSAKLDADGAITGRFESADAGYSGVFDRHALSDKKEDEYIRNGWLNDLTGAQLDSFTISNRDSVNAPLMTTAYFSSSDHAHAAGDNIYFNPVFFGRQKENPFKLQERTFPVDFAYGRKLAYTLNLTLPEGYGV
jgi:hypothetical protein